MTRLGETNTRNSLANINTVPISAELYVRRNNAAMAKAVAEHRLSNMDKQSVMALQYELVNNGYYKVPDFVNRSDAEKTKELQKTLVDLGYLEGKKEIDGIYGRKTKAAFKQYWKDSQIDGIVGQATMGAYQRKIEDDLNSLIQTEYAPQAPQVPQVVTQNNRNILSRINTIYRYGTSGIGRWWGKRFGNDSEQSLRANATENQTDNVVKQEDSYEYYTTNYNHGSLPTKGTNSIPNTDMTNISADLNSLRFGYKNYGDTSPARGRHLLITPFEPFVSKQQLRKELANGSRSSGRSYIGLSPNGEFKVSQNLDDMPDDYSVANTFSYEVLGFDRDDDGKLRTKESAKNKGRKEPVITIKGQNGEIKKHTLNVLTGAKNSHYSTNMYDNVAGGKVIMECDGELRLESGSADDLAKAYDSFKSKHPNRPIRFYVMDNGTYSRTLDFKDNDISTSDLRAYQNFNRGRSGSFAYVTDTVPYQRRRLENNGNLSN